MRRNPEAVLAALLPPFSVIARAMSPISGGLVRLLTSGRPERLITAQEQSEEDQGEVAHAYLEAGEEQGLIERDERRLLQSIVDFGDTLAREVMTPRPDMVAIQADTTVSQLRALFREQEYSRFPVYQENLDNILGIIRVKDLLKVDGSESDDRPITPLIRPTTFVPETKRVPELLKEFQRKQVQMAIVVDEYGGTAGLVTIEDLLEEIVGEIRDEDDVEAEPIVEEGNGSYVFSAKVSFDEFRERLDLEVEPEGFETVGGYILRAAGPRARRSARPSSWTACSSKSSRPSGGASTRSASASRPPPGPPDARRLRLHHRPAQRRQVHAAEPDHRREDRHRLRQAADDADADPRREELSRWADHVRRHAGHPPAAAPDERADGRRRRRDAARSGRRDARPRRVDAARATAISTSPSC